MRAEFTFLTLFSATVDGTTTILFGFTHLGRLLDDFADLSEDWFWETDQSHRFVYFSSRLTSVTGIQISEIIGKTREELIDKLSIRDQERWKDHLADLRAEKPFKNFIYPFNHKLTGQILWIRISGVPVYDDAGKFAGYRGVGSNVTDIVAVKEAIEIKNHELELKNHELEKAKDDAERFAFMDSLTELPNRRFLDRVLENLKSRREKDFAIIHIDLDRFKEINDTLGHAAGDEVLRFAAEVMRCTVHEGDFVARIGGDEFVIVCFADRSPLEIYTVAESIVDRFSKPIPLNEHTARIGASAGVAFADEAEHDPKTILIHADVALFQAKDHGRGCVRVFTPEMKRRFTRQKKLADDLMTAIEKKEFFPVFQPQFDAQSLEIVGLEALVRWNHPTMGFIEPAKFLATAGELNLVGLIDRIMLEKTVDAVKKLKSNGYRIPKVAVNISEARLHSDRFLSDVKNLWKEEDTTLSLELLETVFFDEQDVDRFSLLVDHFREMGVEIEIDDFGSGHASLTSVIRVRPDRIKLDRQLVSMLPSDPAVRAVVKSVIQMARSINIGVIGEGVETKEHAALLLEYGCEVLQGYYLSKPLSTQALIAFLEERDDEDVAQSA